MWRSDDKYKRSIGVLFDTGEGRRFVGQLNLERGDLFDSNVVSIVDDRFVHIPAGGALHGRSEAGKVSLLDCVRGGTLGSTNWGDFGTFHGDVAFRYALFGKRHLSAEEKAIRGIQFTLEGADSSVFMQDKFERFGLLHAPDDEVLDAIERTRPDYMKGDLVKGKAMVSYFTGHWDLVARFETVLGTVHVVRSMQVDSLGRNMEDTPRISIDFDDDPTTLDGAWEKMREVRQFFAWMMGYAPAWRDVLVFTSEQDEAGYRSDTDGKFEVFAHSEWSEIPEGAKQRGTLIDASQNPGHFTAVMQKWLDRNGDPRRKSANTRFFGCIRGVSNRFIEDGIVSAANTFDLLPDEDKPKTQPLPKEVLAALEEAGRKVKRSKYTDDAQRQDVLNALGLIRRNKRLRKVIEHRAKKVLSHFGDEKLKDLQEMIRLAVECRNYYTHGTGNANFTNYATVRFLTEVLEFIYAASELLECGWDTSTSALDSWHPIGGFVTNYERKRAVTSELK